MRPPIAAAHAAAHVAARRAVAAVVGLLHLALHRASVGHRHVAVRALRERHPAAAASAAEAGWNSLALHCRRLAECYRRLVGAAGDFQLADHALDAVALAGDLLGDLLLLGAGDRAHEPGDAVLILDADAVVLELAALLHVLGDLLRGGPIVLGVGRRRGRPAHRPAMAIARQRITFRMFPLLGKSSLACRAIGKVPPAQLVSSQLPRTEVARCRQRACCQSAQVRRECGRASRSE